ncbi:hypothetical protein SeLEV6574_g06096 [Synchytrium endobioticum]|uniref:Uncharacterized protein n=1 Tax=Synchytrium endobioticum TaxID=286115 RepID=A0A507CQW6_9FUNG|nr:hypothetical protein SeLEV6574_g06096 [Synchytrium endobioticum]
MAHFNVRADLSPRPMATCVGNRAVIDVHHLIDTIEHEPDLDGTALDTLTGAILLKSRSYPLTGHTFLYGLPHNISILLRLLDSVKQHQTAGQSVLRILAVWIYCNPSYQKPSHVPFYELTRPPPNEEVDRDALLVSEIMLRHDVNVIPTLVRWYNRRSMTNEGWDESLTMLSSILDILINLIRCGGESSITTLRLLQGENHPKFIDQVEQWIDCVVMIIPQASSSSQDVSSTLAKALAVYECLAKRTVDKALFLSSVACSLLGWCNRQLDGSLVQNTVSRIPRIQVLLVDIVTYLMLKSDTVPYSHVSTFLSNALTFVIRLKAMNSEQTSSSLPMQPFLPNEIKPVVLIVWQTLLPGSVTIPPKPIPQHSNSTATPVVNVKGSVELVYLTILVLRMLTKREMLRPFDKETYSLINIEELMFAQQILSTTIHNNSLILSVRGYAREYILVCARRPSYWKLVVDTMSVLEEILAIIIQELDEFDQSMMAVFSSTGLSNSSNFVRPQTAAVASNSHRLINGAEASSAIRPTSSERMVAGTGRWKFDLDAEIRVFLKKDASIVISKLKSLTPKTDAISECLDFLSSLMTAGRRAIDGRINNHQHPKLSRLRPVSTSQHQLLSLAAEPADAWTMNHRVLPQVIGRSSVSSGRNGVREI